MENGENIRLFKDFADYLIIDRRLEERTVERHLSETKRLFKTASFDPLKATKLDIRNYPRIFRDILANGYANILKTLRVFYRDYLGRVEVVEGFRFPVRPFSVISIPSNEEVQKFYLWLKEPFGLI